ncbi:hypothetical protein MBLNU457_3172t1 [Dothideomycetes sp. NU457]
MSNTEPQTHGPPKRGSSESRRARETQKYIDSWTATTNLSNTATSNPDTHRYNDYRSIADASTSASPLVPLGGDDTSLAAFAQLATLRLNVKRCIISLLGTDREYILAESTRTISLQTDSVHAPTDALWLGACSIPRSESLTSLVVDQWRGADQKREPTKEEDDEYYTTGTSEHWLIASDVRKRPDLLSCPFVKYCPRLRFITAVPIRTPAGKALGSLMIMDDIPRYGLSDTELVFLEDIADTIFGHLELKRATLARQRGDRLIKGLSLFNEGKDSLRQWWLENYSRNERGEGNRRRASSTHDDQNLEDRANEELGMTYRAASDESKRYSGHSGGHSDQEPDHSDLERTEKGQNGDRVVGSEAAGQATKEKDTHASDFNVSREISNVFARASNLIRESASADGVLFVEADMASPYDNRGRFRKASQDMAHSSTDSEDAEGSGEDARRKGKDNIDDTPCSLLGFSTKVKSSVRGFAASPKHTTLPRSFIRRLIRRYPHGKVFTIRADGSSWSSSGGEGTSASSSAFSAVDVLGAASVKTRRGRTIAKLAEVFPDVQSVAFLPMWDARRERWRSAAFVWSSFKKRLLESEEDLTYLLAFSNSILAELSRLDVVASDNAKATFIASVSHELRSPLHGILAGAEFLQETQLTLEQQEMARTVTLAGNTLLDTINHILDFAKINSFTDKQRKARVNNDVSRNAAFKSADMGEVGVTGSVDLAVLTESVADTVVKAYQFQSLSKQGSNATQDPVHFLLDIDVRPSWRLNLSPGSWTRLITNLVGNSFKYTKRGHIKLRLTATDEDEKKRSTLSLIVEDTGQGISPTYLQQYLYTPFMQENSHASGTGLGLSIVKQIADDMGGHIDIESEVGRGTRIKVSLKARFLPQRDVNLHTLEAIAGEAGQKGVTLGIVASQNDEEEEANETEQSVLRGQQDESIRNVVSKTCSQWLRYEPQTVAKPQGVPLQQICMILDTDYRLLLSQQEKQGREPGRRAKSNDQPRIIVLTTLPQFLGNDLWLDDRSASVVFVTQPFGPRKLSRVISTVLSENKMLENRRDLPTPGREQGEAKFGMGSLPQSPSDHANTAADNGTRDQMRPSTASSRKSTDDGNVSPSPTPSAQSGKILLVEDNEINMNLLVAMAKRLQRPYAVAYNGLEAVQEYSKNPAAFVLVLMDMSMPIMDGFTATETIRNMESKNQWNRVRIVAVTGLGSNDARKQAFQSGVDDFMIKPARLKKLKALIEAAT